MSWKGDSVSKTTCPSGIVRVYMGFSRPLSRAVYGETEGGVMLTDHAVAATPSFTVVRLSRLNFQDPTSSTYGSLSSLGGPPHCILEPSTCELIKDAYAQLASSADSLHSGAFECGSYTPLLQLVRHHITGGWVSDYVDDTSIL